MKRNVTFQELVDMLIHAQWEKTDPEFRAALRMTQENTRRRQRATEELIGVMHSYVGTNFIQGPWDCADRYIKQVMKEGYDV